MRPAGTLRRMKTCRHLISFEKGLFSANEELGGFAASLALDF